MVGNSTLAQEMDNKNKDDLHTHCGIFHNKYKPEGSYSTVWCYYATTPVNVPSSLMTEGKKWYEEISSATKLLDKILARRDKKNLSTKTSNIQVEFTRQTVEKKIKMMPATETKLSLQHLLPLFKYLFLVMSTHRSVDLLGVNRCKKSF